MAAVNFRKPPEPVVRVSCERDGDVTVPYSALTIRICTNTHEAAYRWNCPDCGRVNVHLIHPSALNAFLSLPIRQEWWDLPLEMSEPHVHPPITADDCADFMRELSEL